MVRTRRAHQLHMQITRWLPNEVLIRIIRDAEMADQATLCRVSKLFHALSLPILYRTVVLRLDDGGLSAFCSSLVENPERADAIRSFTIKKAKDSSSGSAIRFSTMNKAYHPDASFSPDYRTLGAAMKLMTNLERLLVLFDDGCSSIPHPRAVAQKQPTPLSVERRRLNSSMDAMAPILAELTCPRLTACVLMLSKTYGGDDWLEQFLMTHGSKLTAISLALWVELSPPVPSVSQLRFFHGDADLLPRLGGSNLEGARLLYTKASEQKFNDISLFLKSSSSPTHPLVVSNEYLYLSNYPQQLDHSLKGLSIHVPHIVSLELRPNEFTAIEISRVLQYLPRFIQLQYVALHLPQICREDEDDDDDDDGDELELSTETLDAWAIACPTLKACSLCSFLEKSA
ncbi:hypothetical protein FB45DRAFT_940138 [Roridomyces roridus]|uniref:F-box domain-containing protein n=1 Tax=Roridomyces roridus TaxID=1738132 RepID=A0AAD7FDC2_9AGAR|nr:hypothetical protein FB45DRAFT_940138 [Roridomyces roridus]